MNVGNKVIHDFEIPKMFVNFSKSHYLKLLWPKKGNQNTFGFALKCLLKNINLISSCKSFKSTYCLIVDLTLWPWKWTFK